MEASDFMLGFTPIYRYEKWWKRFFEELNTKEKGKNQKEKPCSLQTRDRMDTFCVDITYIQHIILPRVHHLKFSPYQK
jgi:hypothetical protein